MYSSNYRYNLKLYWRQFYPSWDIPNGYHVHHIKPKCTFEDENDLRMHHPRNLIALHPDDHVSIHKCRGDKIAKNFITATVGRIMPLAERKRRSGSGNGMYKKKHTAQAKNLVSIARKGKAAYIPNDETKKKCSLAKLGSLNPMYNKSPSISTRVKMSKAHIGNKNGMYDKRHTPASLQKMKDNCKKISIIIDDIVYKSIKEARNSLGITYYELSKILKTNRGKIC